MLIDAKERSPNPFFKEALMTGCWSLWNHRNNIVFEAKQRDMEQCIWSSKQPSVLLDTRQNLV
jgi:hypothetical protein